MHYVVARINGDLFVSEIVIDILQTIRWVADAWNELSVETIKNYFAACRIIEQTSEDKDDVWMRNSIYFSTNRQIQTVT